MSAYFSIKDHSKKWTIVFLNHRKKNCWIKLILLKSHSGYISVYKIFRREGNFEPESPIPFAKQQMAIESAEDKIWWPCSRFVVEKFSPNTSERDDFFCCVTPFHFVTFVFLCFATLLHANTKHQITAIFHKLISNFTHR